MRKKLGSGLVDYVIPTLVIGVVVGVCIYNFAAKGNLLGFVTKSGNMRVVDGKLILQSQGTLQSIAKGAIEAGQLNGTADQPANQCSGGVCAIDYGSVVLNGIPEDYNHFVETSGTSAGTDKVSSLIDQIVKQSDQLDPPIDPELLRNLANLGHQLSSSQKDTETIISRLDSIRFAPMAITQFSLLGSKQMNCMKMNSQIQNALDQINSKYAVPANQEQANILNAVNTLGKDILFKNSEYTARVMSSVGIGMSQASSAMSHSSVLGVSNYMIHSNFSSQSLLHPHYSTNTNINSAIICVSGKNQDTGQKCN